MDEDGAHTDGLGCAYGAKNSICQQVRTETLAMPVAVDSQPTQQQDWHWVWHVATNVPGGRGVKD